MEKLKYKVDDSTVAKLLGIQNFTNKESAILEIVKNAYDAQAKNVKISFFDKSIIITDDGIGMSADDIRNNWMYVGKSEKEYKLPNSERILAGSKGVGRFALARLGAKVVVYSHKRGCLPIVWDTDWDESLLEESVCRENENSGTTIKISYLRDRWTEKGIKNLIRYLSITYNNNDMNIIIEPNYEDKIEYVFKEPILGENFVSKIQLNYYKIDNTLKCVVESDEFIEDAKNYCVGINLNKHEKTINIYDELVNDGELDLTEKDLKEMLLELGDFSAEFYFSLKSSTKKDIELFLYKHRRLNNRYEYGVVLYRNAFSITSYDGETDWLELNKRSRKSPAAATHPTGAWRVRSNQLSGHVNIDKVNNEYLTDLANRQGLEENDYYKLFVKVIQIGIAEFERYRQNIIRSIYKKNVFEKSFDFSILDKIIEDITKGRLLSAAQTKEFSKQMQAFKKEQENYKEEKANTEEKYRYDVRILNGLATTGLKASSVAHEMKNDRNNIAVNYDYIVEALKKFGFWEKLNSEELTRYSYENVPCLLKRNKEINQKVLRFMNIMLNKIEKQKFSIKTMNIFNIVSMIIESWARDYASLKFNIDMDNNLNFEISEDVLNTIFDNLILNSWQQNKDNANLNINIAIKRVNGFLEVIYTDDGKGLNKKYIDNPMRILEVHETSRKDGHGLGMWIVNNTVHMTGGEIVGIDGTNGFTMKFILGENLK